MARYLGHRFGDYRLVRLLGEGSFAEVYEAEHLYLPGTKAAIKILKDAAECVAIERVSCRPAQLRRAWSCFADGSGSG